MADAQGKITVVNRTEAPLKIYIDQNGVVSGRWWSVLNPGIASGFDVSGFSSYTVAYFNAAYSSSQFTCAITANNVVPPAVVTLATTVGMRP